ncbi:MAG: hypothetical protein AVDCRST_MAG45-1536, partial [uncultured Solirubrobacterales bacterium]
GRAARPRPRLLRGAQHRRPRARRRPLHRQRGSLLHAPRAPPGRADDRRAHPLGGRADRGPLDPRARHRAGRRGVHRVDDDLARSRDRRGAPRPRHRVVSLPRRADLRGACLLSFRPAQSLRRPDRVRPRRSRPHSARV